LLKDVLRKAPSLSQSKAMDAAMKMPGGKEAWLEHKARMRAA